MLFSIIHFNIFSMTNQTFIMIIFNYFSNKGQFGNLVFPLFKYNFNLSHPSNHSHTLL